MIAVIFEFTPFDGRFADYKALAEGLADDVRNSEGFISIERFESITTKGKFVSLSFWRDEESVRKWRNLQKHREAQKRGRGGIFKSYRLRIAEVRRDYTMDERAQAPGDSVQVHG
ncbi:MAG TPA: antibiotic biosynthesis monooxygenase [Burkholderiales bacterium]|jgi:heme-degrading monooxygenase HmoA|nr:antibiotic biosynthesis monooxygenase [Burkholderiales bacterium]